MNFEADDRLVFGDHVRWERAGGHDLLYGLRDAVTRKRLHSVAPQVHGLVLRLERSKGGGLVDGPRPVLPERSAEIHAEGGKLKFVLDKNGELEIHGNRIGLKALAAICSGLSESDDAYHYHLDDIFWGTEAGSIPTVIYRNDEL